ncbi:MAG: hypothetical protein JRF49_12525, partial [Deltaproteobacteria bacterium]|nr:hypothetical protein [Deltaproteobacteria bacterium]
ILSRIIFYLKGGSFLATPIEFAKQYLDPVLLESDLLRSIFYLHSQPPLFNFFLGAILKLSPIPAITYDFIFKIVGLLIPLIFYGIFIRLGINRLVAFIATIIFMLNPTLILYENLLYYTHIEAFLVLLSIFFLLIWSNGGKLIYLILFWVSLLCLGMIRSLFHPVFFIITAVVVFLYLRCAYQGQRLARNFLLTSFIVLIPMFSLCIKNICLYNFFGTSSWTGMSLWIKVNGYAPEQLDEFYESGLISQQAVNAGLETFQPIHNLLGENDLKNIPCHHPADCNEFRSSGKPNYNHSGYVSLSKQLWKDAVFLISNNPSLSAFYTAGSYSLMLWHSSDSVHALFTNNMEAVDKVERLYRYLYFGFLGVEDKRTTQSMWWMRTIVISAIFLLFYASTLINLFRRDNSISPALLTTCLFCLIIHAYTLVISSIIEFGENNRFRYPVDGAFLVLAAGNIVIWGNSLKTFFTKK